MDRAAAPPRLTIALTFDHDAISSEVDRGDGPALRSRGEFGPRVGVPRVLELLASREIPATFFVPGHTAVTFPESVASIVAGGHELACHGFAHEDLAELDDAAQEDVLRRSRDVIEEAFGRPPAGFRAPYWSLAERTLEAIEELGFAYDSSLMWDDLRLGFVRHGDRHDRAGSTLGTPGRLVEVPISWTLDDWPQFEPTARGTGPMSAPSKVEEIWMGEIRHAWEREPGGVFTITMHPEAIGRGSRIVMLERIVDAATALDGVVFDRLDRIVERWLASGGGSGQ